MGFNQHQSFHLRDRWLTKAFDNLQRDPGFFTDGEAFEKVGLGKNMVQSLKYWVHAFNLYQPVLNNNVRTLEITALGQFILEHDKTLKFKNTVALLHYELCKNSKVSNTWYWFFNILGSNVIEKDEALNQLTKWAETSEGKEISANSLKRDLDCLIRTYTAKPNANDPEDIIFSPLHKLELIEEKQNILYKKEAKFTPDNLAPVAYCILDYCQKRNLDSIQVEDLVKRPFLPGKVFNLRRNTLISLLNEWEQHSEFQITLTRTNNLDTIRLPKVAAMEFLTFEYGREVQVIHGF